MRTRVSTLLLVLVQAFPACSLVHDPNNASEGIRTEYLRQHWLHSYEEDQESDRVQIYRPIDFKEFPPSRFRMQYVFRRNGDCDWFYLDEAVTGMRVGERRKLIVPPSLSKRTSYPENGLYGPEDTLYYNVILLQTSEQ